MRLGKWRGKRKGEKGMGREEEREGEIGREEERQDEDKNEMKKEGMKGRGRTAEHADRMMNKTKKKTRKGQTQREGSRLPWLARHHRPSLGVVCTAAAKTK